tara:strand:- start:284 stop:1012 length:729 start_codon:yes stop_codon:yes gene_type:complete
MKKLNRKELRILLESEAASLDEGIGSALTSLVGAIPAFGDAIAAIKAGTWDLGNLLLDANKLADALKPYGLESMTDLAEESQELDQVFANVAIAPESERIIVEDALSAFGDSFKDIIVSLVSMFPDGLISGPVAFGLANLPVEEFIIEGAELIQSLREQLERIPGGSLLWDSITLVPEISSTGGLFIFFGSPVQAFSNLGKLSNAVDGQPPAGVELPPLNDEEIIVTSLVAESKWLKIAGIK